MQKETIMKKIEIVKSPLKRLAMLFGKREKNSNDLQKILMLSLFKDSLNFPEKFYFSKNRKTSGV
jgi:hypothetical protein